MQHINLETLQSLRELAEPGEPDPLKEFVDVFLSDTPGCLARLKQTCAAKDVSAFARASHTLKGSSSNLGAERLAEFCQSLEDMAKTNSFTGAETIIQQIETEFSEVKKTLLDLCQ